MHCVAAGVRDHTGDMVAGLSISVPITRWDDDRRRALGELATDGAARLSASLGYRAAAAR